MQKIRYNILLYTKERKHILVDGLDVFVRNSVVETCKQLEVELLDLKIFSDHVQISFNTNSLFEAKKIIKYIKKNSDKELREEFPDLETRIWSNDYSMIFKTTSRR